MYFIKERVKTIIAELKEYIYSDSENIVSYKIKQCYIGDKQIPVMDNSSWDTFMQGDKWGGKDKSFFFSTKVVISKRFENRTIVYRIETGRESEWNALNPQFLVYINGKPVQGMDTNHREVILIEQAKCDETYDILLKAFSGMKEGQVDLISSIAVLEKEVEELYYNIKVPLEIVEELDSENIKSIDILNYLNTAINLIDLRKPFSKEFYKTIQCANDYLEKEFYDKYCGNEDVIAHCVGHTHIDIAWLWTIKHTREKAVRSFCTTLNLMEQYPEYIFMSSQPQLYSYIKEDYPDVYKKIVERVKEGRWEPEGAMWIEADCNISSGEGLIRQILFGKRFFQKEFGVDNKIMWLPDVFGDNAALPQILKISGIEYFMTTKKNWKEYNRCPYDTFKRQGI